VTSVAEWGEKWASGRAAGSNAQYSALRFDPDAIIDGGTNALLAAQIPLGRLNGDMPEKKLNLLQFATGLVAESGTCSPQVVRC
jgi:hypothetical protein